MHRRIYAALGGDGLKCIILSVCGTQVSQYNCTKIYAWREKADSIMQPKSQKIEIEWLVGASILTDTVIVRRMNK